MTSVRNVILDAIASRQQEIIELTDALKALGLPTFGTGIGSTPAQDPEEMPRRGRTRKPLKMAYRRPRAQADPNEVETPEPEPMPPGKVTDLAQGIIDMLKAAKAPVRRPDILAAVPKHVSTRDVIETLQSLTDAGTIVKIGATNGLRFSLPKYAEVTHG